jgi:hypothetical protein
LVFWENIIIEGLVMDNRLIFFGDLNFTLFEYEYWGAQAKQDEHMDYFNQLLIEKKVLDVAPWKLTPTWRNGRIGTEGIGKRLNRFLLYEGMVEVLGRY